MAYEIKLFIGEVIGNPGKEYESLMEIVSVDLCNIGSGPLFLLISFAKGKKIATDFKDFRFLRGVKNKHLGLEPIIDDFFDTGDNYAKAELFIDNKSVKEDLYGDILPLIPIYHVIAALEEELKNSSYRRFRLGKNVLDSFTTSDWSNIYVVPFGH